jgi:hypothetical protein
MSIVVSMEKNRYFKAYTQLIIDDNPTNSDIALGVTATSLPVCVTTTTRTTPNPLLKEGGDLGVV